MSYFDNSSVDWLQKLRDGLIEFVASTGLGSKTINTIEKEFDRLGQKLEELRDSGHIQTASGDALTNHARDLELTRREGESDTELRQRIGLELRLQRSEGTVDDVQELMVSAAWIEAGQDWTDENVKVEENPDGQDAAIRVRVDIDQINDVGTQRIKDVIERAKAAAINAELLSVGEFGYVDVNSTSSDYELVEGFGDVNDASVGGRYSGFE